MGGFIGPIGLIGPMGDIWFVGFALAAGIIFFVK
jgi:hypothetical protein